MLFAAANIQRSVLQKRPVVYLAPAWLLLFLFGGVVHAQRRDGLRCFFGEGSSGHAQYGLLLRSSQTILTKSGSAV